MGGKRMEQNHDARKGTWARLVEALQRRLRPRLRVAVGLSGGADSVVLAEVLHQLGARPVILHFNHRWRGPSADADARWVQRWAQQRKLKVVMGRATRPGRTGEGEAREARWKFFEKAMLSGRLQQLWLAHQSDDQAETVLMQLLRGAGPEGLAGMGEISQREKFQVVRPLLGFSRDLIRQAAREAKLAWREDATNEDGKSWRVRVRKRVIPFLARVYGRNVRGALTRAAEILSGEAEFWKKEIGKLPKHPDVRVWKNKPAAWQRRAIRTWLDQQGYAGPNFSEVEGIRRLVLGGSTSTWQLRQGKGVRRRQNKLFYIKEMGLIAKAISG